MIMLGVLMAIILYIDYVETCGANVDLYLDDIEREHGPLAALTAALRMVVEAA